MIVADTNLVAYTVIPGPLDRDVQCVRAIDPDWVAPLLVRSELLNVVATYLAQKRMDRDRALATFNRGMSFVEIEKRVIDPIGVLNLCERGPCTSYDAEFVWLAKELGVPLVTADQALQEAFPETALSFSAFVGSRKGS